MIYDLRFTIAGRVSIRASVLDFGGTPPLSHRRSDSARALAHSKTWRCVERLMTFSQKEPTHA